MPEKTVLAKTTEKDAFWQYVRGICIVFVVVIHCKIGLGYEDNTNYSWYINYWLIMRQFINFPVAIFVFLSGFFTNIDKAGKFNRTFISGRASRLLLPFFIWSAFYTAVNIVLAHGNVDIKTQILNLIFGISEVHLYYILVLLQLMIITPFLIKAIKAKKGIKILFLLTPLYLIALYAYTAIFNESFFYYQVFFPAWFIFYYAGLWIKIKGYQPLFKKKPLFKSVLLCAAALSLSIVEGFGLVAFGIDKGFAGGQIKFSSFLYVFSLINLLMVIKPRFANKKILWLKYIGDNSYGIYYVHVVWLTAFIILVHFLPSVSSLFPPLFQFIQLAFAVGFSLLSIIIAKKILGDKLANKLLGF